MTRPEGENRPGDDRSGDTPRRGFRRSASTDSGASNPRNGGGAQRGDGDDRRGFRRSGSEGGGRPAGDRNSGSNRSNGGSRGRDGYGQAAGGGRDRSTGGDRNGGWDQPRGGRPSDRRNDDERGGFEGRGGRGGERRNDEGRGGHSGPRRTGGGSAAGKSASGRGGGKPQGRGDDSRNTRRDDRNGQRSNGHDSGGAAARRAEKAGADPVRVVARDVLRAVRERDAYANLVLPGLLRERRISGRDAALATELTYGTARSLGLLDAVIADGAGRGVDEIDGPLLDALRLGTYQLLRTRIGAHAAVDTSVALVRAEFGQGRAGFVNAVLRRVAERTPEEWVERLAPQDPLGHLAFEFAHPVWIAQAFADALGANAGELRDVLEADDARPLVHLVARPGEISAEELALITGGEEGRWSPYAVYLDGGDPAKLEPVREGLAAVQDEGSQLVALALTRAPLEGPDNGRWLDLCAGPGGKTALLAAIADIDGFRVDAVEPAEHRAELVRQTTRGMPVDVHVADGRDSGLTPGFDRILVDAPCTGLGALRRRPEARWRRQPSDVRELVTLQRELLTAAWDLVRPGGVVVYSTCSPHLPETVSVVADVARRVGAEQLDTRELLPGVTELGDGPGAQLWPHRHGTDAMFLAALRKPLEA
ncbi:hypothetical protein JMUB6875_21300 [Nocardia sp. JMUB6875]